MGVTGLWKLIEPCGKPVPVETLEGKILAVDISIWLHQAIKGFQDNKGAALNNAHLLGLFHRLCKLMYYRVKPVFVFDGCVPQLKKDTIARRQQQRSKLNSEAERIQNLLLQSLAKEKVVQQALGPNAEFLLTSPVKKISASKAARREDTVDDMFKLPELPSSSRKNNENQADTDNTDESFNENSFYSDEYNTASTEDSSFEETNQRHVYNTNIQAIDVRSKEFLQLPADVRHEILVDIKETRKQSSWGRLHELPSRSDDFSNFQMKRLLKRRDVQVSLETAEQEMGGRTLTYAELSNIFTEEGILETNIVEKGTKQITSDENTRFLLVKDLKKKLAKKKLEEEPNKEKEEIKEEASKSNKEPNDVGFMATKNDDKKLGTEYDTDLELAIALSLEDEENRVYDEKGYEYDSDEGLKLSKAQRQQLQNTTKGPARSYMIEYAGMNKEELSAILEKTQNVDDTLDIEGLLAGTGEKAENSNDPKEQQTTSESQEIRLCVTDDSDATDSDLEEVPDNSIQPIEEANKATGVEFKGSKNHASAKVKNIDEIVLNENSDETDTDLEEVEEVVNIKNKVNDLEDECVIEETPPCLPDELETNSKLLNIKIDLEKPLELEEDLFADIFQAIKAKEEIAKSEEPIHSVETNDKKVEKSLLEDNKAKLSIKTPPKTEKILSILDELKEQANGIKNIKLENIKLNDSVIEISDDETALKSSKMKSEIIEVCDSDDNEKRCLTSPPHTPMQSPKVRTKSPNFRTPSKSHAITEFFNVDYMVKRTPDKPTEEENTDVPKVKSPFFVRKTPKSGRKSGSNSPSPSKKPTKANKTLFNEEAEIATKQNAEKLDNYFIPLNEQPKQVLSEKDILNEAADILKSKKTTEELSTLASDLAKERQELENERNRQDRMGISITQRMTSDCQDLLRLFGVPFIVAPMEAEAQCAFLDIVQLTNGTITDDSDIWLFGGRTVYKNFFAQNKHVLEFRSEQIEKDFNCDRKKLIQLACLVGSDYTTGIHGIGAVTALEILASFTPKELANKPDEPAIVSIQNIMNTLQRFRNWWQSFKSSAAPPGSSARLALQKKLKNIELHEGFPSTAVIEAYLTPKVDDNRDTFSWGYPDVESLREFTKKNFGWTTSKTDDILQPVLKKLDEKRTQQSIRNYFNVKNALSLRQIRVSKRVQSAIEKMSGNVDSDDATKAATKAKRARKPKTATTRKQKKDVLTKKLDDETEQSNDISSNAQAIYSSEVARGPAKKAFKRANVPNTKETIPQREKDLATMEANKKLAAEILKQTAKETKKKRKA